MNEPGAAAPSVEETVTAQVEEQKPEISALDAIVSDPSPEAPAEAGALYVEPEEGEPAAAVEQPGVAAGAVAVAADPAVTPDATGAPVVAEDEIKEPWQREDGKWTDGKYVGNTIGALFVEVKKGQRNAEKLIGKKAEATGNPFLDDEDDDDVVEDFSDEPLTEQELGNEFGAGIAAALIQSGVIPQQEQPDQQQAVALTYQYAQQAIDSPNTSDAEFKAVLGALVSHAPGDETSRQAVLEEWATRNPVAASQEAANIQIAFAQFSQQQQAAQQQAAAEQAFAQEQEQAHAQVQVQQAFVDAQNAFVERNPDWQTFDATMNVWMAQNRPLMQAAKGNPAAIYAVFDSAYQYAKAVRGGVQQAGVPAAPSELGANMGNVASTQYTPQQLTQEAVAEQRGLAGLETGAAVDDVTVQVANPNPPGLAETPLGDLIGMDLVG